MTTRVTASEVFEGLTKKFKIKEQTGSIQMKLGDISVEYNGKDAIGDLLQAWFEKWLESRKYYFRTRDDTQKFPDFLLSESDTNDFLELKTFNAYASPAFDIANFDSYCTSLLTVPERIDADYLIFSYKMKNSILSINNVWLKKVWEITSPSKNPVKLQVKRGQIYNIRPCTWYSNRLKYNPFKERIDFVNALAKTHNEFSQCDKYKSNWLKKVKDKYKENTGNEL